MSEPNARRAAWVFLTNHAHVLLCIARDPDARTLDIAEQVGISDRTAQAIVADLIAEGYLKRTKNGRRNRYELNRQGHLRSDAFRDLEIGPLLDLLTQTNELRNQAAAPAAPGEPLRPEIGSRPTRPHLAPRGAS